MNKIIIGKNITFKLVTDNDINFIIDIRNNHKHKNNLGVSVQTYKEQKKWLDNYRIREKENKDFYFVVYDNETEERIGLIRLYDIYNNSFEQGSLVIKQGVSANRVLETLKLIYEFGFNTLNLKEGRLRVKKSNKVGNKFHKTYGAIFYKADDELNYYKCDSKVIENIANILKLLGE